MFVGSSAPAGRNVDALDEVSYFLENCIAVRHGAGTVLPAIARARPSVVRWGRRSLSAVDDAVDPQKYAGQLAASVVILRSDLEVMGVGATELFSGQT
jgi:hypothetical protein